MSIKDLRPIRFFCSETDDDINGVSYEGWWNESDFNMAGVNVVVTAATLRRLNEVERDLGGEDLPVNGVATEDGVTYHRVVDCAFDIVGGNPPGADEWFAGVISRARERVSA